MKKISGLLLLTIISCYAIASRKTSNHIAPVQNAEGILTNNTIGYKTTNIGDTTMLSNMAANDTLVIYKVGSQDSGYATGTNIYNDMGFAERFAFNSADSSVIVIGVFALFGGTVTPTSTNSISFKIWDQGADNVAAPNFTYTGFPNNILDSMTVPCTSLGIGATKDSIMKFIFPTPSVGLSVPFFAGYTVNYNFQTLNGDTIALQCTKNGVRSGQMLQIDTIYSGTDTLYDTIYITQNATLWSDYQWHDNYTQNDSLLNNLAIYPIVVSKNPTGVQGITKNNLCFYGNYPNPASNSTTIRYSLAKQDGVTLQVFDNLGHQIAQQSFQALTIGAHTIDLITSTYPAAQYFYILRTNSGEGFAGKIDVLR